MGYGSIRCCTNYITLTFDLLSWPLSCIPKIVCWNCYFTDGWGPESFEFMRTKAVNRCVGKKDEIYVCFPPSKGILDYLLSAWCSLICNYFSPYFFAAAFSSSWANRFGVALTDGRWGSFNCCWFPCHMCMVDSQGIERINTTFRESVLNYCPW